MQLGPGHCIKENYFFKSAYSIHCHSYPFAVHIYWNEQDIQNVSSQKFWLSASWKPAQSNEEKKASSLQC